MKKWAIVIVSTYVLAIFMAVFFLMLALLHPIKYKSLIEQNSAEYELSPALIASVINVESGYKKNAKSKKDAIGLMQIKLETAVYLKDYYNLKIDITEDDLFKPEINIKLGCLYINYLIKKFNNTNTALAAYNAGETRVRTWLKDSQFSLDGVSLIKIPYQETKDYVNKINKNFKYYKFIYKTV